MAFLLIVLLAIRSNVEAREVFHRLSLGARRGGAADLVVTALQLADARDRRLDRRADASASAGRFPIDRDLVTGDDAAPGAVVSRIEERCAPGLHAAARLRPARVEVEDE